MFTLNIRNIVAVGRGGVKWDIVNNDKQNSISLSYAEFLKEARKGNKEVFKALKEATPQDREAILNKIKSLPKGNEAHTKWREAMMAEITRLKAPAVATAPQSPSAIATAAGVPLAAQRSSQGELLTRNQSKDIVRVGDTNIDAINAVLDSIAPQINTEKANFEEYTTAKDRIEKRVGRDQNNNLPIQAADFGDIVIMLSATGRVTDAEKNSTKELIAVIGNNGKGLEHVNLPSILRHMMGMENGGYITDKTMGPWESAQYKTMEKAYTANKAVFDKVFQMVVPYYSALQTPQDVAKAIVAIDSVKKTPTFDIKIAKEFFSYALPESVQSEKDRGQNSMMTRKTFDNYTSKMDEKTFLARVQKIMELGGKAVKLDTLATLNTAIKDDITLRAAFVNGVNTIAADGSNHTFFETGKLRDMNSAIESVIANKPLVLSKLNEILAKRKGEEIKKIDDLSFLQANGQMKKDMIQAVNTAFDKANNEINKPEQWKTISTNLAMAITNDPKLFTVGRTLNMDSAITDTVSVIGGLGATQGNGYQFGLGIDFGKNIAQGRSGSVDVHYGAFNLVPYLGVQASGETFTGGITKMVGGINFNVGIKLGQHQENDKIYQSIARKIEANIASFAQPGTRSTDIQFKASDLDPTYYAGLTSDQKKVEDSFYDNITKKFQKRIEMTDFESLVPADGADQNTKDAISIKRFGILKSHFESTIQSQVNQILVERKNMGMGVDAIGITGGVLGPIQYLLPYISASQTNIKITETRSSVSSVIKSETLSDGAIFDEDTYSLPLKSGSGITKENTTPPSGASVVNLEGGTSSIVGLKEFGVNITLKDGRYTVAYDPKKPITGVEGFDDKEIDESLMRVDSVKGALDNQKIRVQLSGLMTPWSKQKHAMNTWASNMDTFQRTRQGDVMALATELSKILTSNKKMVGLMQLDRVLSLAKVPDRSDSSLSETDIVSNTEKQVMSALYDIRGGAMMDVDQARRGKNFNKPHTPEKGERSTRTRWESMLNGEKMKTAMPPGITKDDYKDIVPASYIKAGNHIGNIEPNMIGAVGSLKTNPPKMTLMPAGTMRIAGDGKDQFRKVITDESKKTAIFDAIIPEGSRTEKILSRNIQTALKIGGVVAYADLRTLFTTGTATIGGKEVKMNGAQFVLCAYGDCTNPAMGIIPGKISVPGTRSVAISGVETAEVVTGASMVSEIFGLTGAAGKTTDTSKEVSEATQEKPANKGDTVTDSKTGEVIADGKITDGSTTTPPIADVPTIAPTPAPTPTPGTVVAGPTPAPAPAPGTVVAGPGTGTTPTPTPVTPITRPGR